MNSKFIDKLEPVIQYIVFGIIIGTIGAILVFLLYELLKFLSLSNAIY